MAGVSHRKTPAVLLVLLALWSLPRAMFSASFTSLEHWLASETITFSVKNNTPFFLPRGVFILQPIGAPSTKLTLTAPVLPQPIHWHGEKIELWVPFSTNAASLMWEDATPGMKEIKLSLKPLRVPPFPRAYRQWVPGAPDPRFHEIPIPLPFRAFLHRLDTHSFPLEAGGFWLKGGCSSRFTLATPHKLPFLLLEVSSQCAQTVTVYQGKKRYMAVLKPGAPFVLELEPEELPEQPGAMHYYPFQMKIPEYFVPARMCAGSSDHRKLGAFISFTGSLAPDWLLAASGSPLERRKAFLRLLDISNDTALDPWRFFLVCQTASDRRDALASLEKLCRHRPEYLTPLLKIFPRGTSPLFRRKIINDLDAALILKDNSWGNDMCKKTMEAPEHLSRMHQTPERGSTVTVFGEAIALQNAVVSRKGKRVTVELYWRCLKPLHKNYKIFVHLVPKGETWWGKTVRKVRRFVLKEPEITGDHYPLNGYLMTSRWRERMAFKESCSLQVPSDIRSGEYEIRVGVYDPATLERLSARNGEDGVTAGIVRL